MPHECFRPRGIGFKRVKGRTVQVRQERRSVQIISIKLAIRLGEVYVSDRDRERGRDRERKREI